MLGDEHRAAERLVDDGPEDWVRWWRATGHRELHCILMTAWDPIGVSDTVEAWDEYDSYALGVAYRLRDAANADDAVERVADYLDHVERDSMGLLTKESSRANRRLAESPVAWHEWSFEQGGRPPHEWLPEN